MSYGNQHNDNHNRNTNAFTVANNPSAATITLTTTNRDNIVSNNYNFFAMPHPVAMYTRQDGSWYAGDPYHGMNGMQDLRSYEYVSNLDQVVVDPTLSGHETMHPRVAPVPEFHHIGNQSHGEPTRSRLFWDNRVCASESQVPQSPLAGEYDYQNDGHISAVASPDTLSSREYPQFIPAESHQAVTIYNYYEEAEADGWSVVWNKPEDDRSIPSTNDEERIWVRRVRDAIANNEGVNEKRAGKAFSNRWAEGATYYTLRAFEKRAWRIVKFATTIHRDGWSEEILDSELWASIKATEGWTFDRRLESIITLLSYSKRACEDLLKGDRFFAIVGAPSMLKKRCEDNKRSNTRKEERLRMTSKEVVKTEKVVKAKKVVKTEKVAKTEKVVKTEKGEKDSTGAMGAKKSKKRKREAEEVPMAKEEDVNASGDQPRSTKRARVEEEMPEEALGDSEGLSPSKRSRIEEVDLGDWVHINLFEEEEEDVPF
ncbi:hypothetical protein P154DRAFT_151256 [Amniculicola lignicola CBS 123094]|uniref:Uncharacterized protein n=1 Tax=Amniculicola lignicola CBS 123094 TaxID=1392246 RepID=A0A6A5WMW6_9PLEO|nr:hypothetical protein P154DRAFT_151256 [Amniculicola lignicola CBS 123094]